MIDQQMAHTIIDRGEPLQNRLPLLDRQMQRWAKIVDLETPSLPIAYVQPSAQAPESAMEPAAFSVSDAPPQPAANVSAQSIDYPAELPLELPLVRAQWVAVQDAEATKLAGVTQSTEMAQSARLTEANYAGSTLDRSIWSSNIQTADRQPVIRAISVQPTAESSADALPLVIRSLPEVHRTVAAQSNSPPIVRVNASQLTDRSMPSNIALPGNRQSARSSPSVSSDLLSSLEGRSQQLPDRLNLNLSGSNQSNLDQSNLDQSNLDQLKNQLTDRSNNTPRIESLSPTSNPTSSANFPPVHPQPLNISPSASSPADLPFGASNSLQTAIPYRSSSQQSNAIASSTSPNSSPAISASVSIPFSAPSLNATPQIQRRIDHTFTTAASISAPVSDFVTAPIASSTNDLAWQSSSLPIPAATIPQPSRSLSQSPNKFSANPLQSASSDLQTIQPVIVPFPVLPAVLPAMPPQGVAQASMPLEYKALPNEPAISSADVQYQFDRKAQMQSPQPRPTPTANPTSKTPNKAIQKTAATKASRRNASGLSIPPQPRSQSRGFAPFVGQLDQPNRRSNKRSSSKPFQSAIALNIQPELLAIAPPVQALIASTLPLPFAASSQDSNSLFHPAPGVASTLSAKTIASAPQVTKQPATKQPTAKQPESRSAKSPNLLPRLLPVVQTRSELASLSFEPLVLTAKLPSSPSGMQSQNQAAQTQPTTSPRPAAHSTSPSQSAEQIGHSPFSTGGVQPVSMRSLPAAIGEARSSSLMEVEALLNETLLRKVERRIMQRLVVESERRGHKKWH